MPDLSFRRLICLLLPLGLWACGEIDPAPPVNDEGEIIPLPAPLEPWLFVTDISPKDEISQRPTIAVEFNAYLDSSTFTTFGTTQLRSGGFTYTGQTDYRMTRRALVFRPNAELEPELTYTLRFPGAANLRSVTGSPLHPLTVLPQFSAVEDLGDSVPLIRPAVTWEEVEEIFEVHCNDCHGQSQWEGGLPHLTPQGLIGRRSQQVDAYLVEPFQPARSYLMHKILPDYPIRRFTVQPPPWHDGEELTLNQIERIEHWIANGAPH